MNFFFKNRKSTSTWLRSINRYYESKVHALKMFLSYYYDIQYSKHFPSFFWLQNENYAWFLNKNSIKIFFQVLDVTYHDKLLEICFESRFFISDNAGSIWAKWRSIFDFWKKSSIFSFKRQKANWLSFCTRSSSDHQIWPNRHWNRVEWTQEMVFNTYHHTRTFLDEKIEIDEKKFQNFFLPISLKGLL